jgi:ABC-type branched-subunit amino acid transport system ATPase component
VSAYLLEGRGLTKHYGGLVVTDDVNLGIRRHETHALIGPNGAGKTTLIAQLSGALAPDRGRVLFDGRDVTGLSAHERARLGFARSFQITSVFHRFTVRDNVALAVQARSGSSFRFWKPVAEEISLYAAAAEILQQVGLESMADRMAGTLSHGEHRQRTCACHGDGRNCCCSTSRRLAWGRKSRAHGCADRTAQAVVHDPPGRARHGRGVPSGRPDFRDGIGAHDRHRLGG